MSCTESVVAPPEVARRSPLILVRKSTDQAPPAVVVASPTSRHVSWSQTRCWIVTSWPAWPLPIVPLAVTSSSQRTSSGRTLHEMRLVSGGPEAQAEGGYDECACDPSRAPHFVTRRLL